MNLLHQTTTKEYIEFLRDENTTNSRGQEAYDLWEMFGKSKPVVMASAQVDLTRDPCTDPIPLGLGKQTNLGTFPNLSWSGTPSVSGPSFSLELTGALPNAIGVLFFSDDFQDVPHFGGMLFLDSPVRGPSFTTDATGAVSLPLGLTPALAGSTRVFQAFFRDSTSSGGLGVSSALLVEFCQ